MTKLSMPRGCYSIDATLALVTDHDQVLADLARDNYRVRRYGDQAAMDDDVGLGRVPPIPQLRRFAEKRAEYGVVQRALRTPGALSKFTFTRRTRDEGL
jgi:hypothetical protein